MANTYSLDLEAGSSQYAAIADVSQTGLDLAGDMSAEAWVKFESTPGASGIYTIISKYQPASNKSYLFYLYNDAGTLNLRFIGSNDGSTDNTVSVTWTPSVGTWYHTAVTKSGTTVKFYVNAAQQGTDQTIANATLFNGTAQFSIGEAGGGSFFDGLVDDVRMWSDVRTGTEITNNYQVELAGNEANLVGYWKLNNDYLDETANNNDLTASGSPVFSTDIPSWPGVTNQSYAYF